MEREAWMYVYICGKRKVTFSCLGLRHLVPLIRLRSSLPVAIFSSIRTFIASPTPAISPSFDMLTFSPSSPAHRQPTSSCMALQQQGAPESHEAFHQNGTPSAESFAEYATVGGPDCSMLSTYELPAPQQEPSYGATDVSSDHAVHLSASSPNLSNLTSQMPLGYRKGEFQLCSRSPMPSTRLTPRLLVRGFPLRSAGTQAYLSESPLGWNATASDRASSYPPYTYPEPDQYLQDALTPYFSKRPMPSEMCVHSQSLSPEDYVEQPNVRILPAFGPDVNLPAESKMRETPDPILSSQSSFQTNFCMLLSEHSDGTQTAPSSIEIDNASTAAATWPAINDKQTDIASLVPEPFINLMEHVTEIKRRVEKKTCRGTLSLGYPKEHARSREGNYKVVDEWKTQNAVNHMPPDESEKRIENLLETTRVDLDQLLVYVPSQSLTEVLSAIKHFERQRLYRKWSFQWAPRLKYKGPNLAAEMRRVHPEHKPDGRLARRRSHYKAKTKKNLVELLEVTTKWMKQVHHCSSEDSRMQFEAIGREIVETCGILQKRFEEVLPWK